MNPEQVIGVLRGIAVRPVDGADMREVAECDVEAGRGVTAENRKSGKREVTLLSLEAWQQTCRELGADIPWHVRRANFLIQGIDLAACIGSEIRIGQVRIQVHGETRPCQLMDQQHMGLRTALVPECRGGVHGQVLTGGSLRVGVPVHVSNTPVKPR